MIHRSVVLAAVTFLAGFSIAVAEETKSYWDHGYHKDCEAERHAMMDKADQRAFSLCRGHGGVNKKKTDFVFIVDKGQKLGSSFQTHFCEVKGDIYCNK